MWHEPEFWVAVAFVLFLCILAVTLVQLAVAKRMGAYE